jgi:uncharacterized protein (TIGR02757 family)
VARRHRPTPEFADHLRALYATFPFARSLDADPLSCVRPYARRPRAAEAAGMLAATLAIGTTTSIRRAFAEVERRVGGDVGAWVEEADRDATARALASFRHRWIRGDQLTHLARTLRAVYSSGGSLEDRFLAGYADRGFAGGLDSLAGAVRSGGAGAAARPPDGYARLFPTPLGASRSPCKRLVLYVRWMVRPGYPDLGVWRRVPTGDLRVPLDQHVFWIAYHLGLTSRRTRSWAAVEEVTEALRRIDPIDPIRFDFVLCHTGVSGDCPKRADLAVCGPCLVRPDCRLWRGRVGG